MDILVILPPSYDAQVTPLIVKAVPVKVINFEIARRIDNQAVHTNETPSASNHVANSIICLAAFCCVPSPLH